MSKALFAIGAVLCILLAQPAHALPPLLSIGECDTDSTYVHTLLGQYVYVYAKLDSDQPLGRVEARIHYARGGVSFLGAWPVGSFKQWEYATWRHVPDASDSGGGTIRLSAIADLDNGTLVHPDPASLTPHGAVYKLLFLTSSNINIVNSVFALNMVAAKCGDIVVTTQSGTAYIPAGSDGSCFQNIPGITLDVLPVREASIALSDPDDHWDPNLDGIRGGVGDAVLFQNYFIYGDAVWNPYWIDIQKLETDINEDGITLTTQDFRQLMQMIVRGGRQFPSDCPE